MASTEKSETKKVVSLNIEIGCKLSIQLQGLKERLSSFLIGMEPKSYLIIKTPLRESSEYLVSEGSDLIIRYVHFGEVYGFHATALLSITNPTTITFLSFPK
ncbi:MAG TPA: flagellar brake protein [Desulfobacteraceae bacterium]|nr:flagellar brake protein [Desulfobacteraceae bacterium]HPJ66878.1 flagellar brake protein [Desulfobacteraceae bacterium]HPQ27663.1 flagellar brake protein [Desulfobacteraceae bacterium]